jgi:hypothetical protein
MREMTALQVRPELKMLVAEAAGSLAKLDADRLEELAWSCRALNGNGADGNQPFAIREVHEAKQDMAALAKVLEATRANVAVMSRLREMRCRRTEYSIEPESKASATEV